MRMKVGHMFGSSPLLLSNTGQVPQTHYFDPHGLFLWEERRNGEISSSSAAALHLCG